MSKIHSIPIDQLKDTFHVRVSLDDDRVLQLAELYENNVEIDPLLVVEGTNEILDGRHRREALKLLDRKEARCKLIPNAERATLIIQALAVNMGGSLPPSRPDINHTIRLLIEEGVPRRRIIENLQKIVAIPPELIQKWLDQVQSAMHRARMNKAGDAFVNGGLTLEEAAKACNVDPEKLRAYMGGKKKDTEIPMPLHELKAAYTSRFHVLSTQTGKTTKKCLASYRDGLMTKAQVEQFLNHIAHLIADMQCRHDEWNGRFRTMARALEGGHDNVAEEALNSSKRSKSGQSTLRKMGIEEEVK